jgi:LIM domain
MYLCAFFCIRMFAPKCAACGKGITPVEGTEETVRVVSMNKDFHVDCYICEDCGIQLTDEPDKRCYPLEGCLLCRSCHLTRISNDPTEPTVRLKLNCLPFSITNCALDSRRCQPVTNTAIELTKI